MNEPIRIDWSEFVRLLAEPFPESAIYWRAGSVSKDRKRAQALPYAEPRVYEDRLNTLCPGLWNMSFQPWGETRIICNLTIAGVTRASTGEEGDGGFAPGTAAEAQAFKRACSKFGLGRYLYDVPIHWVAYDDGQKRLVETPTLPARFLPARPEGGKTDDSKKTSKPPSTSRTTPAEVLPQDENTAPAPPPKGFPGSSEAYPLGQGASAQDASIPASPGTLPAKYPVERVSPGTLPTLSPDRAKAMSRELEKLGFKRAQQFDIAAVVLGHKVEDFTTLTEGQALEIWLEAKRSVAKRAA